MKSVKKASAFASVVAVVAVLSLTVVVTQVFGSVVTTTNGGPISVSATAGEWKFAASLNSTSVEQGHHMLLWANLTNLASTNQTVKNFVEPFVNPVITVRNGTSVWQWNPVQITEPYQNFSSGQSFREPVLIPTSSLRVGQTYLIEVAPLSLRNEFSSNLTLTFQIVIN